jgi:hypothetical protein
MCGGTTWLCSNIAFTPTYSAGAGWRWEVTAQDRNMIAKGIAVTHAQARIDMLRAGASTPVPKRSRRVLTSHPTWYRRLYQVWKARTSLTVLPTRSLTIGGTSRAVDAD